MISDLMMKQTIANDKLSACYLDYNATAPLRSEAKEAVLRACQVIGNPSSIHSSGRAARKLLDESRESIAMTLGKHPSSLIFTSGGTEANALALNCQEFSTILVSAIEHESLLSPKSKKIPVDNRGIVDLNSLEDFLIQAKPPIFLGVMMANNETGVIQPIHEIAKLAHRYGAWFHCDAIQGAGRLNLSDILTQSGSRDIPDSVSLSAHKLGGAMGVGVLIMADKDCAIKPLWTGGGQEKYRRSGTENLLGILSFSAVSKYCYEGLETEPLRLKTLRDTLEESLKDMIDSCVIFSEQADRLPNTSCFAIPSVKSHSLLMSLDLEKIFVSAGSACSSGKLTPSHVIRAMGYDDLASSAIRVSLGYDTDESDITYFSETLNQIVKRFQGRSL
jgi:cysteine desulfurase